MLSAKPVCWVTAPCLRDGGCEQVRAAGGLLVISAVAQPNRRSVLQLRGRAGRRGDPGKSMAFISCDDAFVAPHLGKLLRSVTAGGPIGRQQAEACLWCPGLMLRLLDKHTSSSSCAICQVTNCPVIVLPRHYQWSFVKQMIRNYCHAAAGMPALWRSLFRLSVIY